MKNFSLVETSAGDFRIAPAYDLLNTHLHVDDTEFALTQGLFKEGVQSSFLDRNGKAIGASFFEFGKRLGIVEKRIKAIWDQFISSYPQIEVLIEASFLEPKTKKTYLEEYRHRRNRLEMRCEG